MKQSYFGFEGCNGQADVKSGQVQDCRDLAILLFYNWLVKGFSISILMLGEYCILV